MYEPQNTKCVILGIPWVLMYLHLKLALHNISINDNSHENNLKF